MSYRILISDTFSEAGRDLLAARQGFELEYKPGMSEEELCKVVSSVDGLIIRSATQVNETVLNSAANLKLVVRAGVGTDNIDKKAATAKGIVVMNAPGGNSVSTAEHAMALLFSLARKIPSAHMALFHGRWEKKQHAGVQLAGKKIGIIGLGRIGREVALRCRCCGMEVLGYDPFLSARQIADLGATPSELDTMLPEIDFLTVHVPLTDQTRDLINRDNLQKMKKSAMLINCARGGIYNEAALHDAVTNGTIAGAAVDVFTTEPAPEDHPLIGIPGIITTPHLGASTGEAQEQVAEEAVLSLIDYFDKGVIRSPVNIPSLDEETRVLLAPWFSLANRMGTFLEGISSSAPVRLSLTLRGEISKQPAYYLIRAVLQGVLQPVMSTEINLINAGTIAEERGMALTEQRESRDTGFNSLLIASLETESGTTHTLAGTVRSAGELRFVQLNNYSFDLDPHGTVLLIRNQDKPGVVGMLGTELGNAGINIAEMKLGRSEKGDSSVLTLLLLDCPVPAEVIDRLQQQPLIKQALVVTLPED